MICSADWRTDPGLLAAGSSSLLTANVLHGYFWEFAGHVARAWEQELRPLFVLKSLMGGDRVRDQEVNRRVILQC